jgi:hypothetical protein
MLSRRTVLGFAGAGLFAVPDRLPGLRIGVTGWNLQQAGKVDAVALAAKLAATASKSALEALPPRATSMATLCSSAISMP